jgi:hypothetical protein
MKKRLTVWARKKVYFDGRTEYTITPGLNRRDVEEFNGICGDFTADHISAVEIEIREVKQGGISKDKVVPTERT